MRPVLTPAALLAAACLLAGCAGSGGGGSTPQKTCKPPAGGATVSFANNIQPIFNRSCALSGCHVPASLGGNLDLTAGHAYGQIVNKPSFQQPRRKRVDPGSPDDSYLVMKIEGTPGISGVKMPQGCPTPPPGGSCLVQDDMDAIRQWILECALKN